jgi:putative FmdB family regulatory protein
MPVMIGVLLGSKRKLLYQIQVNDMPIYTFRCPDCGVEEDILVPVENRNDDKFHSCGVVMERLISVPNITIRVYAKDRLLGTLNKEAAYTARTGDQVRSKRAQQALVRGFGYHSTHPGQYRPIGKNAKAFY